MSPVFKGQEVQEENVLNFLTLEDGTGLSSQSANKGLPFNAV
jgi:hypothetical protein